MSTSNKLSIVILITAIGSTMQLNGMQGPSVTRFFVNTEKKIERFLDSGAALMEDPSKVIGQEVLTATPFKFMEDQEKQKVLEAFDQAAKSNDKIKCVCKLWAALLHTSIVPMKDEQNTLTFLVKITKEISKDVLSPCEVKHSERTN